MLWRALCCFLLTAGPAFAAVPRVVVSVKPLHALVAAVMHDVAEPELLITGAGSAHTYSLRPSDAKKLDEATIIYWIGPGFETFLEKPLATVGRKAKAIDVMSAPDVHRLAARKGGLWEAHDSHEATTAQETDAHIWLDPDNAKAIVKKVLFTLIQTDIANAERYEQNAARMIAAIDALDGQLKAALTPVRDRPFIAFHDAYQYFERHYGLAGVGAITVTPDRTPGAARVAAIRKKIVENGAKCVFAEPQFEPKLVSTLLDGTKARSGTLDPEGSTLNPGPNLYLELLVGLTNGLTNCLAQ